LFNVLFAHSFGLTCVIAVGVIGELLIQKPTVVDLTPLSDNAIPLASSAQVENTMHANARTFD